MTLRAHGGVKEFCNMAGSVAHYKLADAGILAADLGTVNADGSAKPVEKAVLALQQKGTMVLADVVDGELHFMMENAAGDLAALQAALTAAGVAGTLTQGQYRVA